MILNSFADARSALLPLACSLGWLLHSPLVSAGIAEAPVEPSGSLSLEQAVASALGAHPRLDVIEWQQRMADARGLQAGLRPNPQLQLAVDNGLGSGDYQGLSQLETTLRLALPLDSSARRDSRLAVSAAESAEVRVRQSVLRLDVASGTAQRFIDLLQAQQAQQLAQRSLSHSETVLAAARRRVAAGAANPVEVDRASVALERARLSDEHHEHLLLVMRRQLAAQWGSRQPIFDHATGTLLPLPALASAETLSERLRQSPDFALFDAQMSIHSARRRELEARRRGQPVVDVGLRRFEASDDLALVAGLSLPLSLRDRQQGAIAEAAAALQLTDAEREAALLDAETMLYDLQAEFHHAETVVARLQQTLIPQANALAGRMQQGYLNGRHSQLEWLDAERGRLELDYELLQSAADAQRLRVAIERLTALAPR